MAKSGAERMRELRERKKTAGYKGMLIFLPQEYKERFDKLCRQFNYSVTDTFCYLIDHATDTDDENE